MLQRVLIGLTKAVLGGVALVLLMVLLNRLGILR